MTDKPNDPSGMSSDTRSTLAGGKRPYATIDLKATEVKVSKVTTPDSAVPRPAPARTYATTSAAAAPSASTQSSASKASPMTTPGIASRIATTAPLGSAGRTSSGGSSASASSSASSRSTEGTGGPPAGGATAPTIVKKRGGFFSHLTAGLVGGVVALSGGEWLLPQIRAQLPWLPASQSSTLDARLAALEQRGPGSSEPTTGANDPRITALEKAVAEIPALADAQSRLAADTKAALASAASDAGAPEQITRIAALEDQLKVLSEAGATNPAAGGLPQLAALSSKVTDLEASLATQLATMRKSLTDDVEARLTASTDASSAARADTERLDRDLASVKTSAIEAGERIAALKGDIDRNAANVKLADENLQAIKTGLEDLRSNAAKTADIAATLAPIEAQVAKLDGSVQSVIAAEAERRANAERVVLTLELQNLKRALQGGDSYATQLAEVKKTAGDRFDLSALEKLKDQGVPTVTALNDGFRDAANAALDADVEPVEGSVVDRLIAGAKSVVRVRKVNHAADDTSTEAVLGRMETALKENRLLAVLDESKALSPKAQAAAAPLLDKVAARANVDTALAKLEEQLKTSMSGGAPASEMSDPVTPPVQPPSQP